MVFTLFYRLIPVSNGNDMQHVDFIEFDVNCIFFFFFFKHRCQKDKKITTLEK